MKGLGKYANDRIAVSNPLLHGKAGELQGLAGESDVCYTLNLNLNSFKFA